MATTINQAPTQVQMIHPEAYSRPEKYVYMYGGRGGGKSMTAARIVPLLCWENPGAIALVTRKTFPSLRITAQQFTLDAIREIGIPGLHHSSDHYFEFINGSRIYFLPLYVTRARNERLKSMSLNIVWIEEPTECTKDDFDTLAPAVRLPGVRRWFLTFNPPETSDHWLYSLYEQQHAKGRACRIHFGLEDNPRLPQDVKQELYDLADIDEGLYRRFAKGEWGVDVKRKRVWTNIEQGIMAGPPQFWFGGIDWGWNNPSSAHLYGYQDPQIHVAEEIYGSHMSVEALVQEIKARLAERHLAPDQVVFAADSARPDNIERALEEGLRVIPAPKGKESVAEGITEVRRYQIVVDEDRCPNAWRELTNYIYPEDKNGRPHEEPLKLNDHSCDDLRYAVTTFKHQLASGGVLDDTPALGRSSF